MEIVLAIKEKKNFLLKNALENLQGYLGLLTTSIALSQIEGTRYNRHAKSTLQHIPER